MELLAIKDGEGKGIYLVNNEEEKKFLIDKYNGCSYNVFKENEEEMALEWAGIEKKTINQDIEVEEFNEKQNEYLPTDSTVNLKNEQTQIFSDDVKKEISLFATEQKTKTIVPNNKRTYSSQSDFISTLEALRALGYSAARIILSKEEIIDIILDDAKIFLGGEDLSRISLKYTSRRGLYWSSNYNWKGHKNRNSYYFFIKKFDKLYKEALKSKEKYIEYNDYKSISTRKNCLKSLIYNCFENIVQPLSKTEIEMHGNFAILRNCFWDIEEVYKKNSLKKSFVTANRRLTNHVINTSRIESIIPLRLNEIFDKDLLEVIRELENEGKTYEGENIFQ